MLKFNEYMTILKKKVEVDLPNFCYAKNVHIAFFVLSALSVFALLLVLNFKTPWVVDDFCKGAGLSGLCSLHTWYDRLLGFYFGWGGRIWGEFFCYILLMLPKPIANVLNSLVYMFVVFLIYFNILGKRKVSISLFLGINFFLWAFLPAFGQDIFWLCGSANYLWLSIAPLLLLGCYRLYYDRQFKFLSSPIMIVLVAILGLFAGWSNEHVAPAILFMLFCFSVCYKMRDKKIPLFAITGIFTTFIGMLLLVLAPGNFRRYAIERVNAEPRTILSIIKCFTNNVIALPRFAPLAVVILVLLLINGKSRNKILASVYALGAFLSCIAYTAVGQIGSRVAFAPIAFLTIALGILYKDEFAEIKDRKNRIVITIILMMSMTAMVNDARKAIWEYDALWKENLEIIQTAKAKGELDVMVHPNVPKNKFCAAYGLEDIKPADQIDHWLNTGVARYYKLHTIQSGYIPPKTE